MTWGRSLVRIGRCPSEAETLGSNPSGPAKDYRDYCKASIERKVIKSFVVKSKKAV